MIDDSYVRKKNQKNAEPHSGTGVFENERIIG
jgi:hypothetical protein